MKMSKDSFFQQSNYLKNLHQHQYNQDQALYLKLSLFTHPHSTVNQILTVLCLSKCEQNLLHYFTSIKKLTQFELFQNLKPKISR